MRRFPLTLVHRPRRRAGGLASDRAIDTIIYGKDVPGVRKQASGKGGAVPVRQSDKSAKSERKAKELLDSKVADKDTKSASDEEE